MLTVTRDGVGSGEVHLDPAGIVCGTTCAAAYDENTMITLTAVNGYLSVFAGWSGGGCSDLGACTVTMRRDERSSAGAIDSARVPHCGSGAPGSRHCPLDISLM